MIKNGQNVDDGGQNWPPSDFEGRSVRASETHLVENGKSKLLFDVGTQIIFGADEPTLEVVSYLKEKAGTTVSDIKQVFQGKYGQEAVLEVLTEMARFGLLLPAEKPEAEPEWQSKSKKLPDKLTPRSIALNITHKCNLNCIYCYGDGGSFGTPDMDMPFDVAKAAVDWQTERVIGAGYKDFGITFFGGEPLANFALIPKVVEYAKKVAQANGLNVDFGMTTNASLVTEEIAAKLFELGVNPMVSIDGPPGVQNIQRPFADGRPSYDATINGVMRLTKTYNRRMTARATFLSYDLVGLSRDLYRAGFGNVLLSPATGTMGEHFLTEEGCQKLVEGFNDLYSYYTNILGEMSKNINYDGESDMQLLPRSNMFAKSLQMLYGRQVNPWPCGAGRSYVDISPEGTVYLCHRFVGDKKNSAGNLLDGSYSEDMYRKIIEKSGNRERSCKKCWIRMSCAGGCFHHNLVSTGDIFTPHQFECELSKKLTELAIVFFHKFHEENPKLLKKICDIKDPPEYNTGV